MNELDISSSSKVSPSHPRFQNHPSPRDYNGMINFQCPTVF